METEVIFVKFCHEIVTLFSEIQKLFNSATTKLGKSL